MKQLQNKCFISAFQLFLAKLQQKICTAQKKRLNLHHESQSAYARIVQNKARRGG